MKRASAGYKEGLMEDLADPAEAAAYLNAAIEEGSQEAFLMALRDVAEANGMARLAGSTKLNRESMYRMLSKRGNPQLSSLAVLLEKLGLKLAVEVKARISA
jgi:probable addiction module antidote protein